MARLSRQQLEQLVSARGLRMTPQRLAIVEFLESTHWHPTAEQVYAEINRRFPMTSRATVYNTLNLLRDAGLVQEVEQEGVVHYDPNLSPHHHFICRRCGAIQDVPWEALPPLPARTLPGGLQADSYEVTLRGLCAACRIVTE